MKLFVQCDRCKAIDERHFSDPKAIGGHIPIGWLYIRTMTHRSWNTQEIVKARLLCSNCAEEYEFINTNFFSSTP